MMDSDRPERQTARNGANGDYAAGADIEAVRTLLRMAIAAMDRLGLDTAAAHADLALACCDEDNLRLHQ